jgi:hypothetical protein
VGDERWSAEDDGAGTDDRGADEGAVLEQAAEERAAMRAYLQRSEVRLSTIHRVATALLSGAGLMVLLPVVGRDAVVDVCRHLSSGELDLPKGLLGIAVVAALTVPIVALLYVLRDLTEFYFHANHVEHARGETFAPRFTLTGLRLPVDELGPGTRAALEDERRMTRAVELVVPDNDAARARIDERIAAYGGLGIVRAPDRPASVDGPPASASATVASDTVASDTAVATGVGRDDQVASATDLARAEALFVLAASRPRTLVDEVAKVEHGMVRHVLRIQMIVLRYVKALLALLTTALAVFAASAVVEGKAALGRADEAWLAGLLVVWAPFVILAVGTPVRWLERQLRNEGATHTAVGQDRALTEVEDATMRIAVVGFVAAAAALVITLPDSGVATSGRIWGAAALALSVLAMARTIWARIRTGRRAPSELA